MEHDNPHELPNQTQLEDSIDNDHAPATLSPRPLTYDKPINPTEMPHISTCTEMTTNNTNILTQDDKYPWLDPEDK